MAVKTEKRPTMISFELTKEEFRLIEQRAKQQGISRSQYVREAIYLEFLFSGDLEAMKYMAKRVSARVKDVIAAKVKGVDIAEQVAQMLPASA